MAHITFVCYFVITELVPGCLANLNFGPVHLNVGETTETGKILFKTPSGIQFVKQHNADPQFELTDDSMILKHGLDYETDRYHILNVSISNGESTKALSVFVTIEDENDERPQITVFHDACSIPEELPVGTDVGRLFEVTDADAGDSFTYNLTGEHARYLKIDPQTGRVTMKERLERDGRSGITVLYRLDINVTDKGNNSAKKKLVIQVLNVDDNPPRFERPLFTFQVHPLSEEKAIGRLSCFDEDVIDHQAMPCNISIREGNNGTIFHVEDMVLYADMPKLLSHYEQHMPTSTHVLLIEAADNVLHRQTHLATTVAIVKVFAPEETLPREKTNEANEHKPVWVYPVSQGRSKFPTVQIPEDTEPGSVVLSVHADDMDKGESGKVLYSFTPRTKKSRIGRPNLAGMFFQMHPETGNLSVAMPLDRDKKTGGVTKFTINILATDCGTPRKSVTAWVTLLLKNVNDNGPVFDKTLYKVSPPCGQDLTKGILSLQVIDLDNDIIRNVMVDGIGSRRYAVHKYGRSFSLMMKEDRERDAETNTDDVITLKASDGSLDTTANVIVHLPDCNAKNETMTASNDDLVSPSLSTSSLSSSSSSPSPTAVPITTIGNENQMSEVRDTTTSPSTTTQVDIRDGLRLVTVCTTTSVESLPETSPSALDADTIQLLTVTTPKDTTTSSTSTTTSSTSDITRSSTDRLTTLRNMRENKRCLCQATPDKPKRKNSVSGSTHFPSRREPTSTEIIPSGRERVTTTRHTRHNETCQDNCGDTTRFKKTCVENNSSSRDIGIAAASAVSAGLICAIVTLVLKKYVIDRNRPIGVLEPREESQN